MQPEQWQQIERLFHDALERAPRQRAEFLAEACQGDAALQREIVTLLEAHDETEGVWAVSASDLAAEWLNEQQLNEQSLAPTLIGQQISHYQIESLVGKGGMGEVWRAHDQQLGRDVALKVLPATFAQDTGRLHRFEQEARAISALNHPNIITIHEVGHQGDLHFIIMELVEGESLRQHLQGTCLPAHEAIDIVIQIAGALAAAHQAGLVHRDIKPENVMIRSDGYVKVLDFGLAKLSRLRNAEFGLRFGLQNEDAAILLQGEQHNPQSTTPGLVMGTASYMSPEQASGLELDARSDIWSLGCVLFEIVTGRKAFDGATTSDIIAAILKSEQSSILDFAPSLPAELERIVRKALSKDQAARYQTVKNMALDLERLKKKLESGVEPERAVQPESKNFVSKSKRRKLAWN